MSSARPSRTRLNSKIQRSEPGAFPEPFILDHDQTSEAFDREGRRAERTGRARSSDRRGCYLAIRVDRLRPRRTLSPGPKSRPGRFLNPSAVPPEKRRPNEPDSGPTSSRPLQHPGRTPCASPLVARRWPSSSVRPDRKPGHRPTNCRSARPRGKCTARRGGQAGGSERADRGRPPKYKQAFEQLLPGSDTSRSRHEVKRDVTAREDLKAVPAQGDSMRRLTPDRSSAPVRARDEGPRLHPEGPQTGRRSMVKVYSEEIAAFYDPKTKTMHLIKEPPEAGDEEARLLRVAPPRQEGRFRQGREQDRHRPRADPRPRRPELTTSTRCRRPSRPTTTAPWPSPR